MDIMRGLWRRSWGLKLMGKINHVVWLVLKGAIPCNFVIFLSTYVNNSELPFICGGGFWDDYTWFVVMPNSNTKVRKHFTLIDNHKTYKTIDVMEEVIMWLALTEWPVDKSKLFYSIAYWVWHARSSVVMEGDRWNVNQIGHWAIQQMESFWVHNYVFNQSITC